MGPDQERRSSPRVDFSGITLIHTPRREIYCIAGNISESGILLYPQQTSSAPSSPMRVTFALPVAPRWIELEGKLVRQTRRGVRTVWALRFVEVPGEVRQLLRQYARSSTSTVSTLPTRPPRVDTPPPVPAVKLKLGRGIRAVDRTDTRRAPLGELPGEPMAHSSEPPPIPEDALEVEVVEPPPIPVEALEESDEAAVAGELDEPEDGTEPGTGRIPPDELEQLANSLGDHPEPTRRTDPEETAALKERCREPG